MMIITVDDEEYALKNSVEIIRAVEPLAVIHDFRSPMNALAFAEVNRVDIAFLDIEMGELNGLELAKKLKDIYSMTNIIFLTGYSEYALHAFEMLSSGYILKPVSVKAVADNLAHLRNPIPKRIEQEKLRVQTFGNFEVFFKGKPLSFSRSKSKELFAYLIHKRGTGCSSKEIASVLYEDVPYTISLQKQVQTVLSTMLRTLKTVYAQDIIIRTFNSTAVDITKVDCDYYNFLNWDSDAVNQYMGEYMANYSWAEFTIGYLDSKVL